MIYLETDSILKAVKRVYEQLFPTGLIPSDHDLEREDSATIVIEPRSTRVRETTTLKDGLLVYSYNYERFFPYAKDMDIPSDEGIVFFEMKFWNDDFVVPKIAAPKGRLTQVIDLLRAKPASRRAVIDL